MKTLDLLIDVSFPWADCLRYVPQVNHLSKRHPEMRIDDVPELTLPIIKPNRDYFCQYCDKVCHLTFCTVEKSELKQTVKLLIFNFFIFGLKTLNLHDIMNVFDLLPFAGV